MLIDRVFHDYLMTNPGLTIDDLEYARSKTDDHMQLNCCFAWFEREPLTHLSMLPKKIWLQYVQRFLMLQSYTPCNRE